VTSLLVSIPALNEERTLAQVIELARGLEALSDAQFLVVDDGSADGTSKIAKASGAEVIRHDGNLGVGSAFRTASQYAIQNGFSYMLTIDADGQFPMAAIDRVVRHGISTGKFTSGSRFLDRTNSSVVPLGRRLGNIFLARLVSFLSKKRFTDVSCGLRFYNRDSLHFVIPPAGFTYTQSTLLDMSFRGIDCQEVPIQVSYFKGRKSLISSNLLSYATRAGAIIWSGAKSYFPNRVILPLVAISGISGTALSAVFVANFLATGKFSGFLFAGFLGGFLVALSLILLGVALILNALAELRIQLHANNVKIDT
jgi:glycosyltransferase involved in cell wall biosynthesis